MTKEIDLVGISKKTPKNIILKLGKECKRCNKCCKFGSGFLINDDLKNIANFLGIKEEGLKKEYLEELEKFNTKRFRPVTLKQGKKYGKCVFLTQDGCRIHKVKPFECRISNCSEHGESISIWFMLNYFVNADNPESIREYVGYLKTHPTLPGGKLEELVPDKEKLKKILSYKIL